MKTLTRQLFDFTGRELHEVAWFANLPIHHGVALYSFFEGFKDRGQIKIFLHDEEKFAEFELPLHVGRKIRRFRTDLSYEQILEGWRRSFPASPDALYDSICQVYDQIGELIEEKDRAFFDSDELNWERRFRNSEPKLVRRFMEKHFLEYFAKYHEGILLAYPDGKSEDFQEPKIFHDAIKDFPLHLLYNVLVAQEVHNTFPRVGPCSEYVLEIPEGEFNIGGYHPSESSLMDVFWGIYLKKLSEEKNYPAYERDGSLRHFVSRGKQALKKLYVN